MISEAVKIVLSSVADGSVRDLRYRQRQFLSLQQWITEHSDDIRLAAQKDDQLSDLASRLLLTTILSDLRTKYKSLDLKQELNSEYSVKHGRDNYSRRTPEQLVYLLPERYTLFAGVVAAICACLCSGTCLIVHLTSDLTYSCTLMKQCFQEALDSANFAIIDESLPEDVISRCLVINQKGVRHKASGIREIFCPREAWVIAVVDRTADLDHAAAEIIGAKSFGGSQSPYAPTCILVNEFVEAEFVELLQKHARLIENPTANGSARIEINSALRKEKTIQSSTPKSTNTILQAQSFDIVRIFERSQVNIGSPKETASLPLLAVSSYDDMIDTLHTSPQNRLLASYIFADRSGAKYLAQFIHSHATFVNHIPASLLVGPAAPLGFHTSASARLRREMMEAPSPVSVHLAQGSFGASRVIREGSTDVDASYQAALKPLPAMDQAPEGDMNFFVQGIYTGFALVVLPAVLGAAALGSYGAFSVYRSLT